MANVDRANGFTPVKHLNGSPYNGQFNIYECPAGEAIPVFTGDLVVLSNSAPTGPFPAVEAGVEAADANGVYIGAVVGVFPAGFEPVVHGDNMSSAALTLAPNYRAASTKQYVMVADSPDLLFEAQADEAVAVASIGLNTGVVQGSGSASLGSTTTGRSGMEIDGSAVNTTSTLPLQVVGLVNRPDNAINAANNKFLVRINTHAYGNVGVAGV